MLEHFPDPHPDEILYSVWARYSDLVRYSARTDVIQELFGTSTIKAVVDLPCRLGFFYNNLPYGHDYNVDLFINYHTLLPFYSPFLSPERGARLREQMINETALAIHRRAGIAQSKIPRPLWLRYCPLCVKQDRSTFGECYWHRLHQVAGVEVCPIHSVFLENSTLRTESEYVSQGFFSAERTLNHDIEPCQAASSPYYETFLAIARDVPHLLAHPYSPRSSDFFREQYSLLLARRRFLTRSGKIHLIDLCQAFVDHYTPALLARLHCKLDQPDQVKDNWLSTLGKPSKNHWHPLQHILVIRFLGCTIEQFFNDQAKPLPLFGNGPWPCLNPACKHYQEKCIATYRLSPRSTGRRPVGVFTCICGFTYTRSGPDRTSSDVFRREQVLSFGLVWEERLRELWLDHNRSISNTARSLGVSNSSIRLQAAKLGLPLPRETRWTEAQVGTLYHRQTMDDMPWYRSQLLALLEEAPEAGRSALRDRLQGVYRWLYKHDQEWLIDHLPPKKPSKRYENSRQVWRSSLQQYEATRSSVEVLPSIRRRKSDAEVAEAVRAAASQLVATSEHPIRVTFYRISRDVPQVRLLKRRPDEAPKTMQALKEVTETSGDYAVRYIQWIVHKYQEEQIYPTRSAFLRRVHNLHYTFHLSAVQRALDEAMDVLSQFA